jgi:AcrR family transcriptional regulator
MQAVAPSPVRPLRRDAERNRRRILDAARAVFAERGLSASLDEIARHAGVGVATVYRRFADKEALIDALFVAAIDDLVATGQEGLADTDPWRGLVHFLERSLEMQAADRGLKELMLDAAHGRGRVAHARERMHPVIEALVARARASGDLRADVEPTDLPLMQLMLGSVVDHTRDVEPEAWRRFLTIVLDGLRARRDAPARLPGRPLEPDQVDAAIRAPKRRSAPRGRGRA